MKLPFILIALFLSLVAVKVNGGLVESERLTEYFRRNYTWPIQEYVPDTEGWRHVMGERLQQVHEIEDIGRRYEGFIQTLNSAVVAPNFTEHGFGLGRAPNELMRALRSGIRDGLANGAQLEGPIEVIDGPQALFINRPDLTSRVLHELKPMVEAWSGLELQPYQAYGFRLYQNQSALWMHVDKAQTHVISFILHIDKSEDSEPWPIFIEDLNGNTHEVILTSGDMLFYESSKMLHGRPRRFNGSWYSSIFVHYYPKDGWQDVNHLLEREYAVPPGWSEPATQKTHVPLQMVGTSFVEPSCPDMWCATQETIKWSGPGEHGLWIDPTFEKHTMKSSWEYSEMKK